MREDQKQAANEVISELAAITRHSCNYQQITQLIMDKLAQVIDYTVGVLFYIKENEMLINVKHNSTREFLINAKQITVEELRKYTETDVDIDSIKSIIHEAPEALSEELIDARKVASFMSVPLIIRENVHGILLVSHHQADFYTQSQNKLLEVFTNHASIVIDNVILFTNAEQRMLELSVLHEVGKTLSSILNLEELLKLITAKSAELVKSERVSLMFIDEKEGNFYIKSAKGLTREVVENTEQPIDEGVAGMVANSGEILIVTDIEKEKSLEAVKSGAAYHSNSFISLPIIIRNITIGVLNVSEKTNGHSFVVEDA